MVTKSEETETLKEAIGADIADYLIKPVNPRQVLSVVTRLLEGDRIRQQRLSRDFATRFRELEARRGGPLGWREWVELVVELVEWEVRLRPGRRAGAAGRAGNAAGEPPPGLRPLPPAELRRAGCTTATATGRRSRWTSAPSSSGPVLDSHRRVLLVVVDCLRLDQWAMIRPLISARFDIETAHYFSILPTATPFSRNAIFSGLFPAEIKARYPRVVERPGGGEPQRARGASCSPSSSRS